MISSSSLAVELMLYYYLFTHPRLLHPGELRLSGTGPQEQFAATRACSSADLSLSFTFSIFYSSASAYTRPHTTGHTISRDLRLPPITKRSENMSGNLNFSPCEHCSCHSPTHSTVILTVPQQTNRLLMSRLRIRHRTLHGLCWEVARARANRNDHGSAGTSNPSVSICLACCLTESYQGPIVVWRWQLLSIWRVHLGPHGCPSGIYQ